MTTKYDVTTLDRDSLPEEVLHEINECEGMGKELVSIKEYSPDEEFQEDIWDLTFFEPFFSFEDSTFDSFYFVRVCYSNWPTKQTYTYYHNITRGDMQEALKYESKRQKEDIA